MIARALHRAGDRHAIDMDVEHVEESADLGHRLVARRIVCEAQAERRYETGERFGLIRFGSRTDLYLPASWSVQVMVGQRMVGGETIVADALSAEPLRQGMIR